MCYGKQHFIASSLLFVPFVCMPKQLSVPRQNDPKQTVNFRTLLLNKCQQEFEKDKQEELDLAEMQKKIDTAESVRMEDYTTFFVDKGLTVWQAYANLDTVQSRSVVWSCGNILLLGERHP